MIGSGNYFKQSCDRAQGTERADAGGKHDSWRVRREGSGGPRKDRVAFFLKSRAPSSARNAGIVIDGRIRNGRPFWSQYAMPV